MPLLTQLHRQVAALLDAVERTAGHARLLAFNELRRYLAAHEAAEEEAVHPAARTGGGAPSNNTWPRNTTPPSRSPTSNNSTSTHTPSPAGSPH